MKTVKPLRVGVLTRTFEFNRRYLFAVTPMVCFRLGAERQIVTEVDMWKAVTKRMGEGVALDEAMPKATGEMLVTASAYAPGGQPAAAVMVQATLGRLQKRLRVSGDRYWLQSGEVSRPVPFTEMPVTWQNAFGGSGFARNPLGKGARVVDTPYGKLQPLPNVEDPARTIESPTQREEPAGFGGYDFAWPQRSSKLGTYDAQWLKNHFPGLAPDLDWTAFNVAPPDQRAAGWFRGDETYSLEGMHPTALSLKGALPGVTARAFVTLKTPEGATDLQEVSTRLDTVHFYPDIERGVLIFRGLHVVATDDASDVLHLVLACEDLGAPRPIEHYRAVLAQRLDKKTGALYAFRDRDLMPVSSEGERFTGTDEMAEMGAILKRDELLTQNLRRRAERERQRALDELQRRGIDPSRATLEPQPEPEVLPELDELPAVAERADRVLAEARAMTERAVQEALEQLKANCARAGLDPEEVLRQRETQGGPPRFTAYAAITEMRRVARVDPSGEATRKVEAALTREKVAQFHQTEEQIRETYRLSAHEQPPAALMDPERSQALKDWLKERWAAGHSFARFDLTGADLAGTDLKGADLREAWLEGAQLQGSDLSHADLEGAVLARADLTDATLTRAQLRRANLGGATLHRARLDGADLTEAIVAKADLTEAVLDDASLVKADLREMTARNASFKRVCAREALWLQVRLAGVDLAGCELTKCLFIECELPGAVFDEADLGAAVFMTCRGDTSRFLRAKLGNLRMVHGSSFAGCDFTEATLDRANLRGTVLRGSSFNRCAMDGADLSECDLTGARLYRATAREGRFAKADLTGAALISLNAMMSLFTHATIQDADFTGANLFRADLLGVRGRPKSLDEALLTQVRHVQRDA
jgi:uncharacterized protein YjbI with pentapeptide repeats